MVKRLFNEAELQRVADIPANNYRIEALPMDAFVHEQVMAPTMEYLRETPVEEDAIEELITAIEDAYIDACATIKDALGYVAAASNAEPMIQKILKAAHRAGTKEGNAHEANELLHGSLAPSYDWVNVSLRPTYPVTLYGADVDPATIKLPTFNDLFAFANEQLEPCIEKLVRRAKNDMIVQLKNGDIFVDFSVEEMLRANVDPVRLIAYLQSIDTAGRLAFWCAVPPSEDLIRLMVVSTGAMTKYEIIMHFRSLMDVSNAAVIKDAEVSFLDLTTLLNFDASDKASRILNLGHYHQAFVPLEAIVAMLVVNGVHVLSHDDEPVPTSLELACTVGEAKERLARSQNVYDYSVRLFGKSEKIYQLQYDRRVDTSRLYCANINVMTDIYGIVTTMKYFEHAWVKMAVGSDVPQLYVEALIGYVCGTDATCRKIARASVNVRGPLVGAAVSSALQNFTDGALAAGTFPIADTPASILTGAPSPMFGYSTIGIEHDVDAGARIMEAAGAQDESTAKFTTGMFQLSRAWHGATDVLNAAPFAQYR